MTAYLGVPFAAPPVGELRWRPPQPAARWEGVRKATAFGTSCMQNQAGSRLPWTEEFMTQGPIGEDCLFLNVWTAARNASARLPVMFWIYGGGFNEGSSSVAVYNGAELATKGVIVVSVNYRVGPLGFLAHPELTGESEHHSSGNYGLSIRSRRCSGSVGTSRRLAAIPNAGHRLRTVGRRHFGDAPDAIAARQGSLRPRHRAERPRPARAQHAGRRATLADREAAGARYVESKGAKTLAEMRALPASVFFAPAGGRGGAA